MSTPLKIFVGKNAFKEKENHPDLILNQITEQGEFVKVGALWRAKTGNGYSGQLETDKLITGPIEPVAEEEKSKDDIFG